MCNKTINLTRMDEIALRSHMAGSKHQANIKLDGGTTGEVTTVYFKGKGSEGQMSTSLATQNGENVDTGSTNKDTMMSIPSFRSTSGFRTTSQLLVLRRFLTSNSVLTDWMNCSVLT